MVALAIAEWYALEKEERLLPAHLLAFLDLRGLMSKKVIVHNRAGGEKRHSIEPNVYAIVDSFRVVDKDSLFDPAKLIHRFTLLDQDNSTKATDIYLIMTSAISSRPLIGMKDFPFNKVCDHVKKNNKKKTW